MIETKLFEILDRNTFIPVMATRLDPDCENTQEIWLLRKSGFDQKNRVSAYVMLTTLVTMHSHYDPVQWGNRTLEIAHGQIEAVWDNLGSGDVIDVEYLLNETRDKRISERWV